ncbi:ABC transporter substrate-binding protein [Agromyces atrinae]|uniref:ABC transporter substrate-binding protein n=1 Tax=Agromyces atrinae TaxID=592376 RepID=UPI001F5A26A6|nr:ABC transporter substrate-binding protein [Agromyces atrinae]MCI2957192.1 ABC transporter substrate-binding protein [Agromyces atrinae]
MTQRRRRVQAGLAALGVATATALLVSGCTGTSTATPSGTPNADGTLVIGVTTDANTLYPWTTTQFQATNVLQNIYGTLTEFDENLEVVPGLAESWETSEDGLTVTFTLREGVTYSNGAAFDSADVVASLTAIKNPDTAAVSATNLASVSTIEAPDASTVVLTLSAPDAALVSKLAPVTMAILDSDDTAATLETAPNGTGPYMLDERKPNESISLVRNTDYWGDTPGLGGIEFRVIPDEAAIVSALQSGNVQMAVFDDALVADTIGASAEVAKTPQLNYHALQFNSRKAPFDNLDLRLAIQCAIDRQQVLDTAALGEGEVTGPITSPAFLSDPDARPCPEADIETAEKHLADAGYADGITIDAIVMQDGYSTAVAEAENVQAQLAEIGITLNLEVLESGAYVDRWVAGDFGAAFALNGGQPDPDAMYGRYFTSTGNLNAVAGYSSDTLDTLFAAGKASNDLDERKQIYADVSKELEDNAVWVWLFTGYNYTATAPSVQGFTPLPNGSLQYLRDTTITG